MNNNERGGGCVGLFSYFLDCTLPRFHVSHASLQHKPFLLKTTWRGVEYHHHKVKEEEGAFFLFFTRTSSRWSTCID